MLRSIRELRGYKLAATDGSIGKVKDLLFDEEHWTLRWIVADTGGWLPGRKVLISPVSIGEPDWQSRSFPVRLTKQEIEDSPGIGTDKAVSREYERIFFNHFAWPYYWDGTGIWGSSFAPGPLFAPQGELAEIESSPEADQEKILRSVEEVVGYHIQAQDGEIGHVEDFIVDDQPWRLRYMVVDTRNWLPGGKVLVATDWLAAVRWADRVVEANLSRAAIKKSPEYKASAPVNREYEMRLYDYYGRPAYWK
jgi:uncharacterized protein YrrD